MEGREKPSSRGKIRFAPKAPKPSRKPKLAVPKTEENEVEREAAQAQYLLGRFTENQTRQRPRADKKPSVEVAFGPGAKTGPSIKTFGAQRDKNDSGSQDSGLRSLAAYDAQMIDSWPSVAEKDGTDDSFPETSTSKIKKSYREPWDYHHSYYPITLPLRRPFSGDPELLDEAEFGEAARSSEYNEKTLNPASELGMLEEQDKGKMILFRFPPKGLPLVKQSGSSKGKEKIENAASQSNSGAFKKCRQLEDLSEGYMGKMLLYKSGAVKLKLGEMLYDVTPSQGVFAQDVAAVNTTEKHCCNLGELGKVAHIYPDADSILDSLINLG